MLTGRQNFSNGDNFLAAEPNSLSLNYHLANIGSTFFNFSFLIGFPVAILVFIYLKRLIFSRFSLQ